MLTAMPIKPDVYWVGALDWNARLFHGYSTEAGITYNAYLIMDEKITLIDTAKSTFKDEFIQRIKSIVDPAKIDVVICNHVEMDHSGNIPTIHELAPNATIYASAPQGVKELVAHFGDFNYQGVKTGDTINIGKRNLTFVQTPMVHWPDNMVTYSDYDKILYSNDCFGQHYATSARFDDEVDFGEVMHQARKYYANIVQPYRAQAQAAIKAVRGLGPDALDLIAPAHGVCWRTHIEDILNEYEQVYASGAVQEKALVVYDSMWESTDMLAHALTDGFLAAGVDVQLMDLKENHESDVLDVFLDCKYICVGSPTLNMQMLPSVASLLTYMKGLSPKNNNRVGIPFGSYGWAPAAQKNIAAQLEDMTFEQPLGTLAYNWIPTQDDLDELRQKIIDLVKA